MNKSGNISWCVSAMAAISWGDLVGFDATLVPQFVLVGAPYPALATNLVTFLLTVYFPFAASYDQFANFVLDGAVERIVVDNCYADVPFGIFVVRGENVMLLGEVDAEKETQLGVRLKQVTEAEIKRALAARKEDTDAFNRGDRFEWPILEDF